ncbi:hypothetical protein EON63_04280 [archaeon]|nr:MAG: hypothetical protein EON63_04280 [archaeon]
MMCTNNSHQLTIYHVYFICSTPAATSFSILARIWGSLLTACWANLGFSWKSVRTYTVAFGCDGVGV